MMIRWLGDVNSYEELPGVLVICCWCFSQSTPESWAQFTHDNIARAEHERLASIQLRSLIDNVIQDTSRDIKEQADAVDAAFRRRVAEVQEAKERLEENLKKVEQLLLRLLLK